MTKIRIAGLDGSKANFGIALLDLDLDTMELSVADLILVKTQKAKNKQVRMSSDNLRRAQEVAVVLRQSLKGCVSAFVEVPSGGQSYDAVLGFGTVIGLYASIEIPVVEVSPSETKMAAVGTKTASKEEMIEWAIENHPDAPWRMRKLHGEMVPTKDNEHLADGVGIAHAGLKVPSFEQTLAILKANSQAA
jgi:Holliday junction resolvasome RuvABC endonuclease subunit